MAAQPNISPEDAEKIRQFSKEFNELGQKYGLVVHWIAYIPSTTKKGHISIHAGGHLDAIDLTRFRVHFDPQTGEAHFK